MPTCCPPFAGCCARPSRGIVGLRRPYRCPKAHWMFADGNIRPEALLQRLPTAGAQRVLGVVDLDLFVPDLNFVFGLAAGDRAVIALPRLREPASGDRTLF